LIADCSLLTAFLLLLFFPHPSYYHIPIDAVAHHTYDEIIQQEQGGDACEYRSYVAKTVVRLDLIGRNWLNIKYLKKGGK
jgi:hypothetical protein